MSNQVEKAEKIINERTMFDGWKDGKSQYCILAQEDTDGKITASCLSASKSEGIKWLTFAIGLNSNKAVRAKRDNRAAICFCSESYNITLRGKVDILTDPESKKVNWYNGCGEHFKGVDDPEYCVLKFTTENYTLFIDYDEITGEI